MNDKLNNTDKNPITKFASLFISNPKVVNSDDYGSYNELDVVPFRDLFNNNDENKPEK